MVGRRVLIIVSLLVGVLVCGSGGCASGSQPPPPAVMRDTPPPWEAPRDAVANIEAAGLIAEPLDTTINQRITRIEVVLDGAPVVVPAHIGIDRLRALQGAAHTHDDSGEVWLEGTEAPTVTLGQFFALWGVRFDAECLGSVCGGVRVTVDGAAVADPPAVVLANTRVIRVEA